MPSVSKTLTDDIVRMPVQPGAAMRLMEMLDDPSISLAQLGGVIESDAALSARLIGLANSSYYGLREPAASAGRAVAVVGLATVRSVVATAILDIGTAEGISVPQHFWSHAAAVGAAAGTLASRVGLDPGEAFAAGLLHDVGLALVFRRAHEAYIEVERAVEAGGSRPDAERAAFGSTHEALGAVALEQLRFSRSTVDAVQRHHDHDVSALGVVLATADTIAGVVVADGFDEAHRDLDDCWSSLGIAESERQPLLEQVCRTYDGLRPLIAG